LAFILQTFGSAAAFWFKINRVRRTEIINLTDSLKTNLKKQQTTNNKHRTTNTEQQTPNNKQQTTKKWKKLNGVKMPTKKLLMG
jgi:hypothetical protein